MKKIIIVFATVCISLLACAQSDIKLPEPNKTGGKPLMDVLCERQSKRNYTGKELDLQTMSDLLWATYGFNREDKRVVPSSQNRQEIDVYVMLSNGVYFYDAKANSLIMKVAGDHRAALGQPAISDKAALTIIYVGNIDKASSRETAFIDTGYSVQNVYLYCASVGLGSVARGSFKKAELTSILNLTENQEITLVQPVGTPE
jgi:SagB-type dehydrogenase family enzyme